MTPYQLTRRSTTNISIRINKEGVVCVSAPYFVPKIFIDKFVSQKSDWIATRLQTQKEQSEHLLSLTSVQLWGQNYRVQQSSIDQVDHEQLIVYSKIFTLSHLKSILQNELIQYLTERANIHAASLDVSYRLIRIKQVTSIWGSCTVDNKLTFSQLLVHRPKELVDYVVAHEVSHIIEKNHSSRFWSLVRRLDPDFRLHRHQLKHVQARVS